MRIAFALFASALFALACEDKTESPKPDPGAQPAQAAPANPTLVEQLQQAKVKATQLQIDQVLQSLDMYKIQSGQYPSQEQGLAVLVEKMILPRAPMDGWGKPLQYTLTPANAPKVSSFGADGKQGGEGFNADISAEQ